MWLCAVLAAARTSVRSAERDSDLDPVDLHGPPSPASPESPVCPELPRWPRAHSGHKIWMQLDCSLT